MAEKQVAAEFSGAAGAAAFAALERVMRASGGGEGGGEDEIRIGSATAAAGLRGAGGSTLLGCDAVAEDGIGGERCVKELFLSVEVGPGLFFAVGLERDVPVLSCREGKVPEVAGLGPEV
jgi:hypothetical protein